MGMTPLALVGGTPHDTDRYSNWLEARLGDVSLLLVENPVWSDAMMNEVFGHPWLSLTYASLPLGAASPVLTNEIKAYLVASVLDDRKADAHWFQRRIPVIRYLVEEGESLLQHFGTGCLADIPHPGFGTSESDGAPLQISVQRSPYLFGKRLFSKIFICYSVRSDPALSHRIPAFWGYI